jgi:hypothetical protein
VKSDWDFNQPRSLNSVRNKLQPLASSSWVTRVYAREGKKKISFEGSGISNYFHNYLWDCFLIHEWPRVLRLILADAVRTPYTTLLYANYFLGRHNDRTTPPSCLKRPPTHRSLKLFADLGRPESETVKLLLSVISRDTINLCRSLRFFHVQIYDINGQSNHY